MSLLKVNRWTEPGIGSVNTYWLETEQGVIVIDGQRELSKAREIKADIDRTGKQILAVFLTHPHPDHFGGIGVFAPEDGEVPVYASQNTIDSIREDRFGLVAASHKVVKDDFPESVRLPNSVVIDGQVLTIGGVRIVVRELGAGEAECMTALYIPDESLLFAGDIVQYGMTAYLLEGRSSAWLTQLANLKRELSADFKIYPGHGEPGGVGLVDWQINYLNRFRTLATQYGVGEQVQIAAVMDLEFPNFEPVAAIPDLLSKDVESLLQELHGLKT